MASTNERPGLNQSLLHLDARWQNSILSRRLPTLNFDTLRSHQASQDWVVQACLRDTPAKGMMQGCKLSYPPGAWDVLRGRCYEALCVPASAGSASGHRERKRESKSPIDRHLPDNLNPRGSWGWPKGNGLGPKWKGWNAWCPEMKREFMRCILCELTRIFHFLSIGVVWIKLLNFIFCVFFKRYRSFQPRSRSLKFSLYFSCFRWVTKLVETCNFI